MMGVFLTEKESFYTIYEFNENGEITGEKMKSVERIFNQVRTELKENHPDIWREFEYFSLNIDFEHNVGPGVKFPDFRWIAVFYVTGGSEGWYIHVEALNHDSRKLCFLGKIFSGRDVAANIVKVISEIMHV